MVSIRCHCNRKHKRYRTAVVEMSPEVTLGFTPNVAWLGGGEWQVPRDL
jgi:hypothetical protein